MTAITFRTIRERLDGVEPYRPDRPGRIEASVALLLAEARDGPEVLLIRRAEKADDPWSGQMGLPGGRRESRDPDLLTTARRESLEEVGFEPPIEALLGELDELAPTTPVLPPVVVRPFVFGLRSRPPTHRSAEVVEVVWVPLAHLAERERMTAVSVRGVERTVPAFVIEGNIVWGMTHRIIKPFLELVL